MVFLPLVSREYTSNIESANILISILTSLLMWVESGWLQSRRKAGKALCSADFRHKKRPQLRSIYILLVPKAGLEPARISTVDFESTASTDFATSALKRYAENVVDYTCRTPPCKRQLARISLSAEIFSITLSDM